MLPRSGLVLDRLAMAVCSLTRHANCEFHSCRRTPKQEAPHGHDAAMCGLDDVARLGWYGAGHYLPGRPDRPRSPFNCAGRRPLPSLTTCCAGRDVMVATRPKW